MTLVSRLIWEDEGQNQVEYALLAGFMALVGVVAITDSGAQLKRIYEAIGTKLKTVSP